MLKYFAMFLSMVTISAFALTKPLTLILDQSYLVSQNANSSIIAKYQARKQQPHKIRYLSGYSIQGYTKIIPSLEKIINSPKHQGYYKICTVSDHEDGKLGFMITEHGRKYSYFLQVSNGKLESKEFKLGDLKCTSNNDNTVICSQNT